MSSEGSRFELDTSGSGYHGRVTEDATVVSVTPQIRVDPGTTNQMVCGFAIINHRKHHDDIPFEVRVDTIIELQTWIIELVYLN